MKVLKPSVWLMLLFCLFPGNSGATSWVDLEPEAVIEQATVIVHGKYDFSEVKQGSDFIWSGYDFIIDEVYRGGVSGTIIAGIDGYDVGGADEFQNKEGTFVLFLEQTKGAEYLVPVAGPNGMIQVLENEVQHYDDYDKRVFSKFLRLTGSTHFADNGEAPNRSFLVIGVILVVMGLVLSVTYWQRRRKA